jgi:hypothetical protein
LGKPLQNRERTGPPAGQPRWGGGSDRMLELNLEAMISTRRPPTSLPV